MQLVSTLSAVHAVVDRMLARFQCEFNVSETVTLQCRLAEERFKKFLYFSKNDSRHKETISGVNLKNSNGESLPINDIDRIIIAFNDGETPHVFVRMNIRDCPLLHYEQLIGIETKAIITLSPQKSEKISWKDFLTSITTKSSGHLTPEIYQSINMDDQIYAPNIDSINLHDDMLCFEITLQVNSYTTNTFTLRFKAFPNIQAEPTD